MPELTTKLGIKKPLGNETVSRAAFNENWDIIDQNTVADKGGVPSAQAGTDASKPTPGTAGRLYIATDTQIIYRDTGTAWQKIGAVKWGDIDGKPASFTPSAHASTHANGGSDPIMPAAIGAETPAGAQAKVDSHKGDYVSHVPYAVATGSANAYSVSLNPAPSAYMEGMAIAVKINAQNTGASTINVNGLGAKAIKKANGNDVSAGNLKAGSVYTLRYNGSNFILQGEGGGGTAQPGDVLSGKTFTNDSGEQTGTMPNRGSPIWTPGTSDQTIAPGYYSGGTILGDANLVPQNILRGVSIFGVAGTGSASKILYHYNSSNGYVNDRFVIGYCNGVNANIYNYWMELQCNPYFPAYESSVVTDYPIDLSKSSKIFVYGTTDDPSSADNTGIYIVVSTVKIADHNVYNLRSFKGGGRVFAFYLDVSAISGYYYIRIHAAETTYNNRFRIYSVLVV